MKGFVSAALLSLLFATMAGIACADPAAAADASPGPTLSAGVLDPLVSGDPRSDGEGPGIVGSPLVILAGVTLLGLTTAGVTVLVVRLRGDGPGDPPA